jgi:sulfide:quinone oxidoreductase
MDRDDAHVLIAGGGVAALEAALALRALAGDRASVELVAPEPRFWYRPMAVAEPFGLGEVRHFELPELVSGAGATFTLGEVVSVDAARRLAHTSAGGEVPYSVLLIACGALPTPAVRGALTFRGPGDTSTIEDLLAEIGDGEVRRVWFAVPPGAIWSLPAYELALMTSAWLKARGIEDVTVALVTPEDEPLHLFGQEASESVRSLLEDNGVELHTRAFPVDARAGELLFSGARVEPTDRVVALPRLIGPRIDGVPQTFEGFVPTDQHGRVLGLSGVYAAGDITTFPVKHGGIAAQQAEAAAEAIAAELGAPLTARPFTPVLRGLLLTGREPRYLRAELTGDAGERSATSPEPLWWPPSKIVGRYLSPFLAEHDREAGPVEAPPETGVAVEVELDPEAAGLRRDRALEALVEDALGESPATTVGEVMSSDPPTVAPEDTLGEIAELMRRRDLGSVLVADYGRLIGILTSRDLLRALAGRVHSSEARAREWMTAEPITVSTETALQAAAVLMAEHDIHHLPVVDGEQPVGMVGMRDVVRAQPHAAAVGLGL